MMSTVAAEAKLAFKQPFQQQVDFFRQKLNLPSERWDTIFKSAHDRGFIVAGATKADLLDSFRSAVDQSIAQGKSLGWFRGEFDSIVKQHGWAGWTGEGSKAGRDWRTRIIYQTNMSTSYAAGRWAQLHDPDLLKLKPYFTYRHADGVRHPRPHHVSWNGITLPHDDVFWQTHSAPNGWLCHCRIESASARDFNAAQADGKGVKPDGWNKLNPKTGEPVGIDKGFGYAPGKNVNKPLSQFIDEKLIKIDARIGAAMWQMLKPALQAERANSYRDWLADVVADPVARGRLQVVGVMDAITLQWLAANKGVAPATAEIALQDKLIIGKKSIRHQAAGDALSADEWRALPEWLDAPDQILYDTRSGKLLYIKSVDAGSAKLAVEFDFKHKKLKGEVNLLTSAFKTKPADIEGGIKGGQFEVVK